jgi:hypothetical protein
MQIELSPDELSLLKTALDRVLGETERELVRTDAPALQHSLNADFERLSRLRRRLDAVPRSSSPA